MRAFLLMRTFVLAASAALALLPAALTAQATWVATLDLEYGGDTVAELLFTDGSTQELKAGQGGTLSFGRQLRTRDGRYAFRGTFGYKFATTAAENADIKMTRFVLEGHAVRFLTPDIHIGLGPVAHFGTTLDGDGFMPDVAFDPSVGARFTAGWRWVYAGYTVMTYRTGSGASANASALGAGFSYAF